MAEEVFITRGLDGTERKLFVSGVPEADRDICSEAFFEVERFHEQIPVDYARQQGWAALDATEEQCRAAVLEHVTADETEREKYEAFLDRRVQEFLRERSES